MRKLKIALTATAILLSALGALASKESVNGPSTRRSGVSRHYGITGKFVYQAQYYYNVQLFEEGSGTCSYLPNVDCSFYYTSVSPITVVNANDSGIVDLYTNDIYSPE